MASDLLQIGRTGTIAARSALELTAQNIANASNPDYARRTLTTAEAVGAGGTMLYSDTTLGGVWVEKIQRSDSLLLQNDARRTASDAERAGAELAGLQRAETAIEQAGIYPAIVEFEAALGALQSDPLNPALRAQILETGRAVADTLNIADNDLFQAGETLRFEAQAGVDQVNLATAELARVNTQLTRAEPGTAGHAALLDQRDAQLNRIAQEVGITAEVQGDGSVNVRLGGSSGPYLVTGGLPNGLIQTQNADGTLAFTLAGNPVVPASGALAGRAQALVGQNGLAIELDALAALLIQQVNTAQSNGTDANGNPGQAFFGGSDAGDIALALTGGDGIAAAAAGASANSLDTSNLQSLRDTLANNGPAAETDRILFQLANTISGRAITHGALKSIAGSAQDALTAESGVDLDAEAANLVRFQQAFQASGKVIQVAADIFNTILRVR